MTNHLNDVYHLMPKQKDLRKFSQHYEAKLKATVSLGAEYFDLNEIKNLL